MKFNLRVLSISLSEAVVKYVKNALCTFFAVECASAHIVVIACDQMTIYFKKIERMFFKKYFLQLNELKNRLKIVD